MGEPCVIVCRECSTAKDPMSIPFRSYKDRALWATGHTARTGHDRWFQMDGYPAAAEVAQEIAIADTVEDWMGDRG